MRQVNQKLDTSIHHVYVIVRRDLSPPVQAVQGIHAAIEATKAFNQPDHPYLVLCSVKNEQRLFCAMKKLQKNGIEFKPFFEPDLDNQLTAIATEPLQGDNRKILKEFQLLKGEK